MAARAIWKGSLQLAGESVPVKLYTAVQDRTVHFNVLEKSGLRPIQQKMVDVESDTVVSREETRKGYELNRGTYVVLTDEELRSTEPAESRAIQLTRFLPAAKIDYAWYNRPYYLGPDRDAPAYFALAEALERQKKEGIARWVMRRKRYVGALRAERGYLLLFTFRFAEEVISAADLPRAKVREASSKEFKMANQLVSALEGPFRPEEFHDEYRGRVMKFIEAKAHGQHPKLQIVSRKQSKQPLAESLAASLKLVKERKEKAVA